MECSAIVRTTGMPCGCRVNDDSGFCGRHGGTPASRSRRSRRNAYVDPQVLEALMDEFTELRLSKPILKLVVFTSVDKFYCGICLEINDDNGIKMNCCNGCACKVCLQSWVNESSTCPYCRENLVL